MRSRFSSVGLCLLAYLSCSGALCAQSPQELGSLVTLAGEHERREEYPAAIQAYAKSVEMATQLYGARHVNVAALNQALAMLHLKRGEYEKARGLLEKVMTISQAARDGEMLAEAANNLATAEWELGNYPRALELHEYGLKLLTTQYGKESPQVAISRSNLAGTYAAVGRYVDAEPLFEQSVRVLERQGQNYHLTLADTLGNQAHLYMLQGEMARAQAILLRAVHLKESLLGPKHHELARSLNNLAAFYSDIGQSDKAEETHLRVLQMLETTLGPDHLDTCRSVLNVAGVYHRRKDYEKALAYYERALSTRQSQLEKDHPDIALTLHNLAGLHVDMNNFDRAQAYYQRALDIRSERLGHDHPHVATTLMAMADMQTRMQNYAEAERLWEQVKAIRQARFIASHPDMARTHQGLAVVYAATSRPDQAAAAFDLSRRGMRQYADQVLPSLSETEQLNFLTEVDEPHYHSALSLVLQDQISSRIAEFSASWVLNSKAVAQQTLAQRALLSRDVTNPLLAEIARTVNVLRKQLASLFLVSADGNGDPHRQKQMETLAREEQEQSRLLLVKGGRSLGSGEWVEISTVREKLPADALLIEIARFRRHDFNKYQEKDRLAEHYVAWIIPPKGDDPIQVVDLGNADLIDETVKRARLALQQAPTRIFEQGENEAERELRPLLEKVAQQILYPLLRKTGERRNWYLSPDSVLWLVPWTALPLEDGSYAIENYDFRMVVSGRDLARNDAPMTPSRPIMIADPNYDLEPAQIQAAVDRLFAGRSTTRTVVRATPAGTFRLGSVERLPGTMVEAIAVKPKLEEYTATDAYVYSGEFALEMVFKRLQQPRVLVISTHGFFQENNGNGNEKLSHAKIDNPLLRCGLLLAGCNKPSISGQSDAEDGILTGLEIIGTDLRGTELVVLSACDTGLGDVRNGEGVAGLRQAFQLAGAKSVIATLWTVPDRETARLIADFFARLAATGDKVESLRNAQLAMIQARRERNEAAHPFFWAAFTITGE